MKRTGVVIFLTLLLGIIAVGGCSRKGETQSPEVQDTTETVDQNEQNEPEDVQDTEKEQDTAEVDDTSDTDKPEENIADDPETVFPAIVYYVDGETAEIRAKAIDAEDENSIWNALKQEGILTEECRINSFEADADGKTITLDFDQATGDRIRSMGTTGETEIVGCIVNSFLDTYGCEKIKLTEDGHVPDSPSGADYSGYISHMTF